MSRKQTLEQPKKLCANDYEHTNMSVKVKAPEESQVLWEEWYACSKCEVEPQAERFPDLPKNEYDHSKCDYDPCFGCKAKGLQIAIGDAGRDIPDKIWNSRLAKYRQARADGIQPGGTGEHFVEAAYKASETLGTAYDGNTMVPAHKVTKGVAETMKEIGDI